MAILKARASQAPRDARRSLTSDALAHAIAVRSLSPRDAEIPSSWTAFVNSLASQDWLILGYLVAILAALAMGKGPNRNTCIVHVAADLGFYLFVLALVRMQLLRWGGAAASLVYRLAILAILLGTFFQLREILPAVSPWGVDARIYAFDVRVFGVEPSQWLDRYVTVRTTEWFAFFYFLYFLILTVHVLPALFGLRNERILGRFGVGLLLVFLTAHLLYMVVPGWGPYWYLKGSFQHELEGPVFWPLVREAVDKGGAQKDIFRPCTPPCPRIWPSSASATGSSCRSNTRGRSSGSSRRRSSSRPCSSAGTISSTSSPGSRWRPPRRFWGSALRTGKRSAASV